MVLGQKNAAIKDITQKWLASKSHDVCTTVVPVVNSYQISHVLASRVYRWNN